ncbi:MAG: hypothetical protein O2899_01970 [Bacteroidetes bacterium]|nr:hypothetical protein [Bacteroidota bacterium]
MRDVRCRRRFRKTRLDSFITASDPGGFPMSDHSTPSSDASERRQKVVMALGIATIVLFSANLLTVLAQHFWPENSWRIPLLAEQESAVETAAFWQVDVQAAPRHRHRVVIHRPAVAPEVIVDLDVRSIERELAKVERQTQRLELELQRELSSIHAEGIRLHAQQRVAEVQAALETAAAEGTTIRLRSATPEDSRD